MLLRASDSLESESDSRLKMFDCSAEDSVPSVQVRRVKCQGSEWPTLCPPPEISPVYPMRSPVLHSSS